MNKDKDFVRLDEVFKRLERGEDTTHPGSWRQMKDLLDKEMPVAKESTRVFRMRYLIPLLALILTGGALYLWQQPSDKRLPGQAERIATTTTPPAEERSTTGRPSGTISARPAQQPGGQSHQHLTTLSRTSSITPKQQPSPIARISRSSAPLETNANNTTSEPLPPMPAAQLSSHPMPTVAVQQALPVVVKENIIRQIKPEPTATAEHHKAVDIQSIAAAHQLTPLPSIDSPVVYRAANGGWYKEQRDTFNRIELVGRYPEGDVHRLPQPDQPVMDTVSIERIARISFIPLSYAEINDLRLETGIKSAIPTSKPAASKTSEIVPLRHYKVSGRQMNNSGISRLLQSANSGLSELIDGRKNWYIALLLGGNTGLSSPNTYGMQVGFSFLYTIAERWTLSLGLQYQQNYYPGFRFWDSAISYALHEEPSSGGTQYSGTAYTEQTSVQVNSLSQLNIPVLLSYNLGRVSLLGGPMFTYFFPLKEQSSVATQTEQVAAWVPDHHNPFTDQNYRLQPETAFQSRLAMGYNLGLQYDFSRKISVDVRLRQMLWDNSGGYSLEALRQLYRQPSVAVNLAFFLGRREKVIYIMDRNR